MTKTLTPPLKYHGGKAYLAKQIIELMPPRVKNPNAPTKDDPGWVHYVEPYFGGGQVLFANDPEGISEVANDLNRGLTNFWCVLRDESLFNKFLRQMEAMPFSEREFITAIEIGDESPVTQAVRFFVRCRQSLAGRMKGFSGVTTTRSRRGMNNEVSAWLTAIEGLPAVHARLKRVLIINRPALEVIAKHDGPQTLFYLDPPYLHSTRVTTGEYAHEMTTEQHHELLELLTKIKGRFILSGYPSPLYHRFRIDNNWGCVDFDIANHSSGAKEKKRQVERLWMNY
jgi:DNA adenine methylase